MVRRITVGVLRAHARRNRKGGIDDSRILGS